MKKLYNKVKIDILILTKQFELSTSEIEYFVEGNDNCASDPW